MPFGGNQLNHDDKPSEVLADSHSSRVSADTSPIFPEDAWLPASTDLGPPETCKPDCAVLTFHGFDIFLGGTNSRVRLAARDHSQHPSFNQVSGFQKGDVFFNSDALNFLFLLPDWAILSH